MNRNRRNIIIAVILLIALLIFPFWPKIQQAMGDGTGETAGVCWTDRCL
ncbi:MAG: hypothetical protein MR419_03360 [Clostridiales bacterium]|nr:hypothetical protein [Clostridiales bacterium]MDY4172783.1 hypothetical protein [Evtepia sp.]